MPLLVAGALAAPALAHQVGLSRGLYTQSDDGIDVELVFARNEAARAVAGLDGDQDRAIDQGELLRATPHLARDIVDKVRVEVAGLRASSMATACPGSLLGVDLTEEDGLAVRARYACGPGRVTVDFALASTFAAGHRHLAHTVTTGAAGVVESDHVALRGAPTFSFGADAAPPSRLALMGIGVTHILLGFDHLVFLFGLVLVGGSLRSLLAIITAFTLAHSLTLALAVLGIVTPPSVVIEPLIALSIAYVGVENFFVKSTRGRWRITAPFGLVHGFGFAGALAEVGVPGDDVPLTLLSFNVGVEAGQLLVLALLLPLLSLLRARGLWSARTSKAASVVVIALGGFWFAERALAALGLLTRS